MFDPIPILLARESVRAGMSRPEPEPSNRGRTRRRAATWLRHLADRLEPAPARSRVAQPGS